MKKLIALIPTKRKTKEQIKVEIKKRVNKIYKSNK